MIGNSQMLVIPGNQGSVWPVLKNVQYCAMTSTRGANAFAPASRAVLYDSRPNVRYRLKLFSASEFATK